jgi:hypothetical protein
MNGYWFGTYSGSNSGEIVVEADDMGFEGCAYVYDAKLGWPSTFAALRTASKAAQFQIKAPLAPLHPDTAEKVELQRWCAHVGLVSSESMGKRRRSVPE